MEVVPDPRSPSTQMSVGELRVWLARLRSDSPTGGGLQLPSTPVVLGPSDLAYNQQWKPTMVSILLQRTKIDQACRGVKVILGRTGGDLCPIEALLSYLGHRGHNPGPLFQWADGSPLTRAQLVVEVRRALRKAGLPEKNYTGHSFRIGATTTTAAAGVEDAMIQAGLGSSTVGLVLKCNKYRLLEYLYLYLILTFKYILYFTCT